VGDAWRYSTLECGLLDLSADADHRIARASTAPRSSYAGLTGGRVKLIALVIDELHKDGSPLVAGLDAAALLGGIVALGDEGEQADIAPGHHRTNEKEDAADHRVVQGDEDGGDQRNDNDDEKEEATALIKHIDP
jgi:hypothetical protein